jgi:photosystem II stability/assembly factor-like uncharacterized protein
MQGSPKDSLGTVSASGEHGSATVGFSRRDRIDATILITGSLLLVVSLLGAYFQKPSTNPKPSPMAWLTQPRERNAFLKLPSFSVPLKAVHFDGPLLGWAVGDNGTILHTADGGQTWQPQTNETPNDFNSIYGIRGGRTLWAVGDNGAILHTTNGGQIWQSQTNADRHSLLSIYGSGDGRTLWAVGDKGTILHTTDGGQTWQPQTNADKNTLGSIYGSGDGKTLWAVGVNGTILHTDDAGQTWQPQTNANKSDLFSIYANGDGRTLWAVGVNGTILHTTDGGQTWQPQTNVDKNALLSIYESGDGRTLWAVGRNGTILHTADGGQTWQLQTNADKNTLGSIYGIGDGSSLWAVGDNGTILHTPDGGQTWQLQTNANKNTLGSIYGSDDGRMLWAVGNNGTILHTADGGQTWQPQTNADKNTLGSIYGIGDGRTLWAVGDNGTILHTTNGGQTWRLQTNADKRYLWSIYGSSDGKTLWAVGVNGTILHTADGGQAWQPQTNVAKTDLLSIYGSGDGRTLWAVGVNGTILHTADGGQTWQPQTNADKNDLGSIYGSGDGRSLWAVGDHGTILHTADGGHTWQLQTNANKNLLGSIYGSGDGKALWAVGDKGTILHTADGGQTWLQQTNADKNFLWSICGSGDGNALWAVGRNGTILHTTDGGATWTNLRNTNPYSYSPASWVWFALVTAVCLISSGSVRLARPLEAPKPSIENAALSDQAATRVEQDLLNAADTVRSLSEFLRNRSTEPPVTISIEGKWGTGKTSVMRMLESELRRARVPTVWFNAWHNEGEEQMLAFLLESIRENAFPKWWDLREIDFRLRLLVIRFKRWPVIPLLVVAVVLFLVHPAIEWMEYKWLHQSLSDDVINLGNLWKQLQHLPWAQLVAIATAMGAAIPILRKLLMLATGISVKPSDLLTESESKSSNSARTSFRPKFAREFCEAVEALGPGRRITIFIDDLDRCQPEQVRQTLEAVNFLITSAGCFVVLGIARDIVEASVGLGFKEIAEERDDTSDAQADDDEELAARVRRRFFARNYLLKLINLTVMLRPYSADLLANVATTPAKVAGRPSFLQRVYPYTLIGLSVVATVILWNVHTIPRIKEPEKVLRDESYTLPDGLQKTKLKSVLVERDPEGNVTGEKRTYDADERIATAITSGGAASPGTTENSGSSPSEPQRNENPTQGSGFEPGQTFTPARWLWWMIPLVLIGAGFIIRPFFFRRQRRIQDSPRFIGALGLWRPFYENETGTPREIKRFVNELRYKAIRFRGPQLTVPVITTAAVTPDAAFDKEPTLILLSIFHRLRRSGEDSAQTFARLSHYRPIYEEHIRRFGEPSGADYQRYDNLFG